jgi:hypothetical protein
MRMKVLASALAQGERKERRGFEILGKVKARLYRSFSRYVVHFEDFNCARVVIFSIALTLCKLFFVICFLSIYLRGLAVGRETVILLADEQSSIEKQLLVVC